MATTYNVRYVDADADAGGDGTTNGLTGGTCAYKSLNIWEAARDADLTTGDGASNYVVEEAICGSAHANHTADTTAVSISGWTTSANSYISIKTDASNRAGCVYSTSKYRLYTGYSGTVNLDNYEDFVRIDGLQFYQDGNTHSVYMYRALGASNDVRLSNCLIRCNLTDGAQYGVYVSNNHHVTMWNCIVYGLYPGGTASRGVVCDGTSTLSLYSCTVIGGQYAVRIGTSSTATLTAKNTYAGGSGTEDWIRASGTLAKTNCASEDQSADDTGTNETATNCVAAAVAYDTDTFVNVTAGSEDFHLAADGLSPLQGAGVDTSGEGAPLNFTTDIEGDTRDATWDIGADAWVEAALSPALLRRRLPWETHLRM